MLVKMRKNWITQIFPSGNVKSYSHSGKQFGTMLKT